MPVLRHLSARPTVVVEHHDHMVGDATLQLGRAGPLGRERVVAALPFAHGNNRIPGFQLEPPTLLVDHHANAVADPGAVVLGSDGIWIPRLLAAWSTEDTRRL